MYYLIHAIYRPFQIFQRYIFTRFTKDISIWFEIWPVERILREPSKDDQLPGEKNNKNGNVLSEKNHLQQKGTFEFCAASHATCHMPHDIRGLASLTSCN